MTTRTLDVFTNRPSNTIVAGGIRDRNRSQYGIVAVPDTTGHPDKPAYRVPLMSEIADIEPNGYTVVSTFSGCGGSCLGFRMAGYRTLWASEFIQEAAATYRANHPGVPIDTRDIREIAPESLLAAIGKQRGDIDVLEGSPPCASFSTAGKREDGWGKVKTYSDTKQRVDDLFFEFARLLDGLQPRVFVAENVSGLVKGTAKGYFKEILRALKACGYVVEARLLDAQWLGVPQARQRLIFVGVRNDLGLTPAFPKPLPYRYSVRDALPWIANQGDNAGFGSGEMRQSSDSESSPGASPQTGNGRYPPALVEISGRTGPGEARTLCELDEPMNAILVTDPAQTRYEITDSHQRVGGNGASHDGKIAEHSFDVPCPTVLAGGTRDRTDQFWITALRPKRGNRSLDDPAPTIQTHNRPSTESEASLVVEPLNGWHAEDRRAGRVDPLDPSPTILHHGRGWNQIAVDAPVERRKFTIAELRRICGFPDDFILTGTYAQQWERLGRAVPPPMMHAVAVVIRDQILRRFDHGD